MTWATLYSSGHYAIPSWFWNFWRGGDIGDRTNPWERLYFCLSNSTSFMTGTGCLTGLNADWSLTNLDIDRSGDQQRYLQYQNQFIDYNSDGDSDVGDENALTDVLWYPNFYGDDDDLYLWIGPSALSWSFASPELYLINKNTNERTFFRLNVRNDPLAPTSATCTGTQNMTWSWCLGTIEILKLTGLDAWQDHWIYSDNVPLSATDNDGIVDTWVIHRDFDPLYGDNTVWSISGMDYSLAHNGGEGYWQSIFSDKVHVSNVEFYVYPNKDIINSWRDTDPDLRLTPYVQIKMTLQPSWKTKRKIRWDFPGVDIATTIQLSALDFK